MKNYINSQLGLIRFLLTALGTQALQQQQEEEEDGEEEESTSLLRGGGGGRQATRNGKATTRGRAPGQVGAPASPGQLLPSPRRNRTRCSPPPALRLLGPSQSPGSTGSPGPFSTAVATGPADPSVPLELAAPSGRSNPRFPSARLGPPFPGHPAGAEHDAPAGPASGSRARRGPSELPRAGRLEPLPSAPGPRCRCPRAPEGPGLDAAAAPLLLTPPAAPRYLRAASTTDLAAGRGRRGGRAGALEARQRRPGRVQDDVARQRARRTGALVLASGGLPSD